MRYKSRHSMITLVGLSISLAAFSLAVTPALASEPRIGVAGASPIPATDTVVNKSITTTFDIVLHQPHGAALGPYIASLSNTASPNYHKYLTPAEFARDFGASPSSVAAVRSYLSTFGLRVGALSKGHILLRVTGPTTDIARAFDTPVDTVRTNDGTLKAQFATTATLPSSIASDVAGVAGLSTVVAPSARPLVSHALEPAAAHGGVASTCAAAGSSTGATPNALGGYTVQQQAQLYGLSTAYASGDTGAGQTIAVYELGQYSVGDTGTYFSCYGLSPSITTVNVDSGISSGYSVGTAAEEATLDIEETSALAPGAAIEVYQGPNSGSGPTDIYQQIADDNTASIVTTSWGTCESDPGGDAAGEQAIFEQMAAQGQTVVAASGDNGSSDCSGITNNALAVDDPASQPYVTGVGALTVSSLSPITQSVWNSTSPLGSSGGGQSVLWPRPTWQNAPGITAAQTMRMVPDLSVMGDPSTGFIEYFSGATSAGLCHRSCAPGWSGIGGTSIGAPLVSALFAVAAQSCAVGRLGFINPTLYAMSATGVGFNDVTVGNNNIYNVGGYSAATGYDMASGLGSPSGIAFINGLCQPKLDASKSSFASSSANPPVKTSTTITAVLRNSSSNPVANALVNASASAPAGTIVIDGDANSSTAPGKASYDVNSDSTGTANFTVTSGTAGPVVVTVTYAGQTLYTTTLNFMSPRSAGGAPGRPTIASLTALARGFKLAVAPPASNGGSAITLYQYSINSGATWRNISRVTRTVTVGNLARSRTYAVVVRARNARGAGASSAARRVTTLG